REAGMATLLIDLLTSREEAQDADTGHLRFAIGLLARRLVGVTEWLHGEPATQRLRGGHFGASPGGGAAPGAAAGAGGGVRGGAPAPRRGGDAADRGRGRRARDRHEPRGHGADEGPDAPRDRARRDAPVRGAGRARAGGGAGRALVRGAPARPLQPDGVVAA